MAAESQKDGPLSRTTENALPLALEDVWKKSGYRLNTRDGQ